MKHHLSVTASTLRRLILAQQGLLAWRDGKGAFPEGIPWREQHRGERGTLEVLRRLEAVQLDPVNVIERNHHLVFVNRVGGYRPEHLEALYPHKHVFEYWAQARCILPIEDWPMFGWRRERWRLEHTVAGMASYRGLGEAYEREIYAAIEHIREKLADGAALPARALDTGKKVQGYWGFAHKATSQAIEHLWEAGEAVVAYRKGDERHFALAEGWLPPQVAGVHESPLQAKLLKFIRAYGVVDGSDPRLGWRNWAAGERKSELAQLVKEGVIVPLEIKDAQPKRPYYLHAELEPLLTSLESAKIAPRVFFLPPLDNLMWRRERIRDLFGFDYKWEIYVPEAKRKYGPYVLPILAGERLIGRLDARMDRAKRTLNVRNIWWEGNVTEAQRRRVWQGLEGFAQSLGGQLG
ncbi:MAG TPA: crosslink repair DNA glycosylase YcaQ family protein [Meiothermus sp.]|nr:crosslink repair DNA glycosylase YcaQ family protein [Meiothermus sp.]